MILVRISKNILVNPNCISSVEQKEVRGKQVIIVWVNDCSYTLDVPLKDFMNELNSLDLTSNGQHFSG